MFQQGDINSAVKLVYSDSPAEFTNSFRAVSTPVHTANSRHTRVIPAINVFLINQLQEFTFTHYGIGKFQTCKLNLLRVVDFQFIKVPVIQWPVVLKFQRAYRVRNTLNRIFQAMSPIVGGIYTPLAACTMVFCM